MLDFILKFSVDNLELLCLLSEPLDLPAHLCLLCFALFLDPRQLLFEVLNLFPLLLIALTDHLQVPLPLFKCLPLLLNLFDLLGFNTLKLLNLTLLSAISIPCFYSRLGQELLVFTFNTRGLIVLLIIGLYRLVQLLHLSFQYSLQVLCHRT
jgi:hypothetical protein